MTNFSEKLAACWKDAANLGLGLWLVASPWALNFTGQQTVAWNAWGVGTVIAIAALAALIAFQKWEEWVNAALAAWLIISPFVLAFGTLTTATWNQIVVGVLVGVLAVWAAMTTEEGGLATKA
jgi:hypothetical protein